MPIVEKQSALFDGLSPACNEGIVAGGQSHLNCGVTQQWGYTVKEAFKAVGSVPLYVVVGCGNNGGEVTPNPGHKHCPTVQIGRTYPLGS